MTYEFRIDRRCRVNFDMRRTLDRAGRYMVGSTIQKIRALESPANAPLTVRLKGSTKPLRDTGALMASITSRVEGDKAIIGTNRIGAHANQFGAVVMPKKGKWLWIPASHRIRTELRNLGGSISALLRKYRSEGYCCKAARKGATDTAMVAYPGRSSRRKAVVLFILKSHVEIPKRPFLYFDEDDVVKLGSMFDVIEEGV